MSATDLGELHRQRLAARDRVFSLNSANVAGQSDEYLAELVDERGAAIAAYEAADAKYRAALRLSEWKGEGR